MNQREYWDSVAETKRFTTPFQLGEFERYVAKDAAILDVGCGYGRTLAELANAGYRRLFGVDFSEKLIERGRREAPKNVDLRVSNRTLPFPDASFDAVLLFAVLTCVVDSNEQKKLLAEISRVLKPGGVLYVNDFLLNDDDRNRARYENFQEKYPGKCEYGAFELPEGALLRHYSQERIAALLAPFETLKYERQTFETMNGHKSNGFYYFGRRRQNSNLQRAALEQGKKDAAAPRPTSFSGYVVSACEEIVPNWRRPWKKRFTLILTDELDDNFFNAPRRKYIFENVEIEQTNERGLLYRRYLDLTAKSIADRGWETARFYVAEDDDISDLSFYCEDYRVETIENDEESRD